MLPAAQDYLGWSALSSSGRATLSEPVIETFLPVDWLSLIGDALSDWITDMPPRGKPYLGDYAAHASNRNCIGAEIEFTVLKSDDESADITYRVWAYRPWPGECNDRS